jgi:hypothetical protein
LRQIASKTPKNHAKRAFTSFLKELTPMVFARVAKSASLVAVCLGVCAGGARAADDGSVFHSLQNFLGWNQSQGADKIDFRERPKLVVPPNRQALPEPRAADQRPASWPVDSGSSQRSGPRVAGASGNVAPGDPKRENLTQPPDGYRHPTKDLSQVQDPEAKKGFNPFGAVSDFGKNLGLGGP